MADPNHPSHHSPYSYYHEPPREEGHAEGHNQEHWYDMAPASSGGYSQQPYGWHQEEQFQHAHSSQVFDPSSNVSDGTAAHSLGHLPDSDLWRLAANVEDNVASVSRQHQRTYDQAYRGTTLGHYHHHGTSSAATARDDRQIRGLNLNSFRAAKVIPSFCEKGASRLKQAYKIHGTSSGLGWRVVSDGLTWGQYEHVKGVPAAYPNDTHEARWSAQITVHTGSDFENARNPCFQNWTVTDQPENPSEDSKLAKKRETDCFTLFKEQHTVNPNEKPLKLRSMANAYTTVINGSVWSPLQKKNYDATIEIRMDLINLPDSDTSSQAQLPYDVPSTTEYAPDGSQSQNHNAWTGYQWSTGNGQY
ncbi:uncharacterized protein I303_106184 [Kwoniella dejecticola CBS 10117]|uniref:Uncharacterized protein n=1 Tax=Kwoniella dejecticola CBS 10117 TaxID=1296121 RepID=A0A1A6A1I2_9TREE|nr:uncharacterized protein I303_06202 [Kwoniella dejecticola CBS 10117]OBR83917.1 hypothetical protein I303_06202 [Kwoniella dejecticola CBS 10117]